MNSVQLTGRITRDIELRTSQSGLYYVMFTLAVKRTNSKTDAVDFIDCVAWNKTAELMSQYLSKGSLIGVVGKIQVRKYESPNGVRNISEVICDNFEFLESKAEAAARRNSINFEPQEPANIKQHQSSNLSNVSNIFDKEEDDEDSIKDVPSDMSSIY